MSIADHINRRTYVVSYYVDLFGIFIAIVALIVYGSLYPWHFEAPQLSANPLYLLFHSWELTGGRRFVADVAVNLALYVPLGMSGYLALRSRIVPVLAGLVLSGCIEITQLFIPGRVCSSVDLMNNVLGSAAGVLLGIVFERIAGPFRLKSARDADRSAFAILFCWAASLAFPFFPETRLPAWHAKISAFIHGSVFSPAPLISAAVSWFAVGLMLRAARVARPGYWLLFSLLLIPAQIAIVTRQPFPVVILGAIAGIVLFVFTYTLPSVYSIAAWAFVIVLAIRGLAPFHFTPQSQSFQWTPFAAFLNTEWQAGLRIFLEKVFYYGAAIWLLRRARLSSIAAIAVVCAVLAAVEIAQTHIPGRTPEITDPLLALLTGLALRYHANS